MDGVIVDTELVHRYACYQQFGELNIEVPEEMEVEIGVYLKGAAKGWGTMDDFEFFAEQ